MSSGWTARDPTGFLDAVGIGRTSHSGARSRPDGGLGVHSLPAGAGVRGPGPNKNAAPLEGGAAFESIRPPGGGEAVRSSGRHYGMIMTLMPFDEF